MLYTTNLIRLTRKVNLTGLIENHAFFVNEEGVSTEGIFANGTLTKLLNFDTTPLTIENDKADEIASFQIASHHAAYDEIKVNQCPSCDTTTDGDYCKNDMCRGRRYDNFFKVLKSLGILYSGNESLLMLKSNLEPEKVLQKDYVTERYAKTTKVAVTNEVIDSVKGMYYVPLLFILGRICSMSDEETDLLVEHVTSEEQLTNLHLTKLIDYDGIKRLHDYLGTPFANWITELDVRYK